MCVCVCEFRYVRSIGQNDDPVFYFRSSTIFTLETQETLRDMGKKY